MTLKMSNKKIALNISKRICWFDNANYVFFIIVLCVYAYARRFRIFYNTTFLKTNENARIPKCAYA